MIAAAMAILCVYYFCTWGPWQGKAAGDGWFGFLYLRAIVFHQTLDMRTVAPEFLPFFGLLGPGGHMPNRCPIGPVFLWMPFYLLALGVMALGRVFHFGWASVPSPSPQVEIVITGIGTLLIVLLGWRALFRLAERHLGRDAGRLAGMVALFATPMLWYTAHHPFYQHGAAFGVVCLFVDYWDRTRGRDDLRRFVVLGLLGGFAAMMRLQEILFLLLPALEIAPRLLRGPRRMRWFLGGVACLLAALIAFSPQLAAWRYYTGSWLKAPQVEPIRWTEPSVLTALFSMRAGLFPWTPIAYAAGLGALFCVLRRPRSEEEAGREKERQLRGLMASLLLAFALNLYVVACAWVLHAGYTYGARRLSDAAVLIGLGVGALFVYSRRRGRIAVVCFAAFCVIFNVTLCELLRQKKIRSSGAEARALASWLEVDLHAPAWLVRTAEYTGYPFVQPVGWLFAARHRVLPATFESVVGNSVLERDGQWMQVLSNKLPLDRAHRYYAASGLRWSTPTAAEVTGPVRLFLPMFAKESAEVVGLGRLAPGPLAVRCNGVPATDVRPLAVGFSFILPAAAVRAGVNELVLELPVGTTVESLQLTARDIWWR